MINNFMVNNFMVTMIIILYYIILYYIILYYIILYYIILYYIMKKLTFRTNSNRTGNIVPNRFFNMNLNRTNIKQNAYVASNTNVGTSQCASSNRRASCRCCNNETQQKPSYSHIHIDEDEQEYLHAHDGGNEQHSHSDLGVDASATICDLSKGYLIKNNVDSSWIDTTFCCPSETWNSYEVNGYDKGGCTSSSGVCNISGSNNKLCDVSFNNCKKSNTKYRGINLTAYDNGNLSGQAGERVSSTKSGTDKLPCPDASGCGKGRCTDDTYDTGGWSEAFSSTTPSQGRASEFIAGNVTNMWSNTVKSSPIAKTLGTSSHYTYATVYPLISQINAAAAAGVNIFRLPFMPTFINGMATGWAQNAITQSDGYAILYVPPSKNYLNYYMTTLNYIITQHPLVKVIMDCHVYQRWCPMNIPGTQACLEGGVSSDPFFSPSRKYSNDAIADSMCPYDVSGDITKLKDALNPINLKKWENATGNPDNPGSITKDNIGYWNIDGAFCKGVINKSNTTGDNLGGDEYHINISGCTSDVSGTGAGANACYGPPTKRILGPDCTVVMWYNILQSKFTLVDGSGNDAADEMSVETYFNQNNSATSLQNSENIWIGLMNEPNEVETGELAKTYGALFVLFRKLGLKNKLLVEGNSWTGLHAQCDPITHGKWYNEGSDALNNTARANDLRDYASGKNLAEAWKYGEMKELTDISNSEKSLLKYFDLTDPLCTNYPCEIIWKGINTALGKASLPTLDTEETNWIYDVHQYMDKNSTGIHTCPDKDDHSEQIYNVDDMKRFTNFDPFIRWAKKKKNNVKIFISEFGVQIDSTYRCNNRLNLFLKMIEDPEYNDIIMGWTIWRAPPPVSWLSSCNNPAWDGTCPAGWDKNARTPVVSWTNSIIFGQSIVGPYEAMYDIVKPFTTIPVNPTKTDPNKYEEDEILQQFCMPALWDLKGEVTPANFEWGNYVPGSGWAS